MSPKTGSGEHQSPQTEKSVTKGASSQIPMLVWVSVFGAIGGVIGWILQESTGGHLLPFRYFWAIPAAMLLGAGAAGVGVYVLARTDLSQVGGALFFALLCGVFFKPVWQAGSDFIGGAVAQAKAKSAAGEVQNAAEQLQKLNPSAPPQQVMNTIQHTSAAASNLLLQTADVPNAQTKKDLQQESVGAVETITAAAARGSKAAETAVNSLSDLGKTAKQTGQDAVAMHVLDSLHTIETTSTDPSIAQKAREAAAEIRRPGGSK